MLGMQLCSAVPTIAQESNAGLYVCTANILHTEGLQPSGFSNLKRAFMCYLGSQKANLALEFYPVTKVL